MKNIVVLGSINIDLIVSTSQFPKLGETVIGKDIKTLFGGKGANQAIAATKLGAHVSMIGRVGCDSYGSDALDNLRCEGVGTDLIFTDPSASSGMAFILVDDYGNNSIIVMSGANSRVCKEDLERSKSFFTPETILVTQLEITTPTVKAGVELARAEGSYIILNPSPAAGFDNSILQSVDALILNEIELLTLSQSCSIHDGLALMRGIGVRTIVLTLGEKGCILVSDGKSIDLPSYPVTAIDTTGAGDAFIGAFSTAIAEGLDLPTACTWGNAAGALATTSLGAQSSLPNRKQMIDLINTYRS